MSLALILLVANGITAWLIFTALTRRSPAANASHIEAGVTRLIEHADGALYAQGLEDAFMRACNAAREVLGIERVVLIYLADDHTTCHVLREGDTVLELSPEHWNTFLASPWYLGILTPEMLAGQPPTPEIQSLAGLSGMLGVNTFVPWIEREKLICVIAIAVPRQLNLYERALLSLWNLNLVQACANCIIERQVTYQRALEREAEQALAIIEAVPSQSSTGVSGSLSWSMHDRRELQRLSGFHDVYRLSQSQLLVISGEVIAQGLAASMLSIAIRSCCDNLYASFRGRLDPCRMLGDLNRLLWRKVNPIGMSCIAVLFDEENQVARYAVAGPMALWRMSWHDGRASVEPCPGRGPLVGDLPNAEYQLFECTMNPGDAFFLLPEHLSAAAWHGGAAGVFSDARFDNAEHLPSPVLLQQMLAVAQPHSYAQGSAPLVVVRVG